MAEAGALPGLKSETWGALLCDWERHSGTWATGQYRRISEPTVNDETGMKLFQQNLLTLRLEFFEL